MKLFQTLQMLNSRIAPEKCKIHLAGWNGTDDPLDIYLAGEFEDWQSWQTKKNFERDFVISLIALPQSNRWLFVGAYESHGCARVDGPALHRYNLQRISSTDEMNGRLIVEYQRDGRNAYRNAENCGASMRVTEIRPERLSIAEFSGYTQTMLTKRQLDTIVRQEHISWKSALASVAGVYVIADRLTGKLYIGSATGDEGIWGRWCAYVQTGHGGNHELRQLLETQGPDYAANFQYGVLETADSRATEQDVLARESHWKQLLLTQPHGYNAN